MFETVQTVKIRGGKSNGFTLIELMAVLAILAIIAAIAVPRFAGTINTAKQKADEMTLEILNRAIQQYVIDNDGKPPQSLEALIPGYIEEIPRAQVPGKVMRLEGEKVEWVDSESS